MTDSRRDVYLQPLSKEDLKNLAKRQQKAQREEDAKAAKKKPQTIDAPSTSSGLFSAPVRVSTREEDSDKRKLMDILGDYRQVSNAIMSGKTKDLMGVEQQPSTPLASKNPGGFFPNKHLGKHSVKGLQNSFHSSDGSNKRKEPQNFIKPDAKSSIDVNLSSVKEPYSKPKLTSNSDVKSRPMPTNTNASSVNPVSSSSVDKPNRLDNRISGSNSHRPSYQGTRPDSSHQNSKKDVCESAGKTNSEERVSVLQSFTQELISHSKKDPNRSGSSASKHSPNHQTTSKSAERAHKKPIAEPVAVLQESKEEMLRNAPNGKFKIKPKLQISKEKNVEEMLKELTHIPQPLTGIQTPFKEIKNPFQDKFTETVHKRDAPQHYQKMVTAPVKVETKATVIEEIQEKSDSETGESGDEGSDSGDDCQDNDDEESGSSDEEGELNKDKEDKTEDKAHFSEGQIPVPANANGNSAQTTPTKVQRRMSTSSSSSGSESSGTESESESELSDTEKHDSPSPEKDSETTPKMKSSSDYMDTSSPLSRQSWNLGAFLPSRSEGSGPLSIDAKPTSIEAPASDKSDPDHFEEVIGVKRSADHVSDENPQSVDPDSVPKPMSADEFSPPPPNFDKQIISPIKSPQLVKSPPKRTTASNAERLVTDSVSGKTKPEMYDRYDGIKNRERKKSTSISIPEVIKESIKQRPLPGRSKKRVSTPSAVPDDSSSSESDHDMDISGSCNSPLKPLPKSPRKSLPSISNEKLKPSITPSKSSSNSSKKESKREKLIKDQKPVKLKKSDDVYSKQSDCDTSSAKAMSNMQEENENESIKNIFNSFVGEKLLSPIPCDPKTEKMPERTNTTKDVRSDLFFAKSLLSESVKYLNGKLSVLVQIDMSLLKSLMVKDKHDPNLLIAKPEMAKRLKDNVLLDKRNLKASKVTSAKNSGTDIVTKSHKVLESEVTPSVSPHFNHSANISQTSASKTSVNSTKSADRISSDIINSKPKVSQKEVNNTKVFDDMPEFDSLPQRKLVEDELSEEHSSDSSSSDSELDESKSSHGDLTSPHSQSFSHSPPEKKKRKIDTHRADDSKRRKTSSSKVLPDNSTSERSNPKLNHESNCDPNHDDPAEHTNSNKKSTAKRERHNSSSSQHSTHSQQSTQSSRSNHSRRSTQSNRSHKKTKLGDSNSDLNSSRSADLPQSQVKSSPSALSMPNSALSNRHGKFDYTETVKLNGHLPQRVSAVARPESDPRVNNHRPVTSNQDYDDEESLLSGTEYQKRATSYKHKADAMPTVPNSIEKYIVFLESVLYFVLSGVAKEKDHHIVEASTMFKDTHRLMGHHFHQFRLNVESDAADKSDIKFTVLCLRIQSLLLFKLYKLKKTENLKLKRILDDHHNKSMKPTSKPQPPSAPSPHQTNWNRSTGTPSPMSPTPSPANSVCSVGSVGSDQTPSKMTNGTSSSTPIVPPGSVLVPQRIHSITQKYITTTNYLLQAHELWEQACNTISSDVSDFFSRLDNECGPLTFHSSLLHLVRYCRKGIGYLRTK